MKSKNKKRLASIDAFQLVFSSPEGKKVLAEILKICHVDRDTFVAGAPDETAWRCGQRSIGLRICELLKLDTKKLASLMREQEIQDEYDDE